MEPRSRRRRSSSRRQLGSPGGGADRISALPDDLLPFVLARLGCFCAAARTGVLSRRWRGLWASLCHIVFRDVLFSSLEVALGRVSRPPPGLSLLEIRVADPVPKQYAHPRVNSASLQELTMIARQPERYNIRVHIVAPVLKQLTVSLTLWEARISVLAPMVEKVSWRCQLSGPCTYFGWRLMKVILQTPERQGQLPSLQLHAYHSSCLTYDGEGTNITQETEKHMLIEFSVLELHLTTKGHVFGGLMSDLLGMNRICSSTQRLKLVLLRSETEEECPLDCACDSPNWRSQTRSLTALEEVEISGFEGDEHEIDFLKLIFKCAPILKIMVVKLSDEASSSNFGRRKINHIFRAWSGTEFYVHSTSDEYTFRRLD